MTRLVFGTVAPCHACGTTGKVRAPAMGKGEIYARARENKRRAVAKLEPLPVPPSMIPCPRCGGEGFIPSEREAAEPGAFDTCFACAVIRRDHDLLSPGHAFTIGRSGVDVQ